MERHIVIPPIVVADDIPGPRSAGTSCQLPRVYRCRAGFDNAGGCRVNGRHNLWHTPAQAETCLRYDYDRCRRERGHELNPKLPYHAVHLPDCGGAIWNDGVMDMSEHWHDIYDLVERSGEHLWWFGDDVEGRGQRVTRSDWTE